MTHLVLAVLLVAAAMTSQQVIDLALALVVAVSPIALRYVSLKGVSMAAVSFAVAAVIALAAGLIGGELRQLDASSIESWAATAGWMWATQQAVYRLLVAALPQAVKPAPPAPAAPV